jgi:UDP-hydrolysing UDP-N-acetyl-D-glucosamine 2-epimerase
MNSPSTNHQPLAAASPASTERVAPGRQWVRHIACISTTRADSGIYAPLLAALSRAGDFEVSMLAGGTHHSETFGQTARQMSDAPRLSIVPVEHFVEGDGPGQVCETAGRAISAFSAAISRRPVDLVFALGDRTEMLAACLAATIHGVPIAHVHGGDVTQGACDDSCRHAITKLAHVHFPALRIHADRIRRMGEEAWRIQTVGSLALDELAVFTPQPIESLSREVGLDFRAPTAVVVFHPETLCEMPPDRQIRQVLEALNRLSMNLLFVGPNADVGRDAVDAAIREFVASRTNAVVASSLSQSQFWSCLAHARVQVGNSSSGIIEAASLRLPVVNVGDRQTGRIAPPNVLHAPIEAEAIHRAISQATSPGFVKSLADLKNPYGDGNAAERIIAAVRGLASRQQLLTKKWANNADSR